MKGAALALRALKDQDAPDELSGWRQVAVLLVSLGQELAAELMKDLDTDEVEQIAEAIAALKTVPREVQEQVVAEFEEQFKALVNCEHAIAVNSCTAAMHLTLVAAGIGPGDEVIVPDVTFIATANAVRLASEAIGLDAKLSVAYYLRGRERFRLGMIQESVQDFDKHVKLSPERDCGCVILLT